MQLQERRQQRSNRPGEAIQLLLEHTLRNFQLDAIALADEDGLVVSHAGDATTCDAVAAYAPLMRDGRISHDQIRSSLASMLPEVSACTFNQRQVAGTLAPLHVCGVGVASARVQSALEHARVSVERILRTLAH